MGCGRFRIFVEKYCGCGLKDICCPIFHVKCNNERMTGGRKVQDVEKAIRKGSRRHSEMKLAGRRNPKTKQILHLIKNAGLKRERK